MSVESSTLTTRLNTLVPGRETSGEFRKSLQSLSIAAVVALSVVAVGWVAVAGTAVAQEEPEAVYNVTEIDTAESVTIGDDLVIETTVTNTGDGAGDQYVAAHLSGPSDDDFVADSVDNVTLEPGESETLTYSLDTSDFEEPGEALAAIHTHDDAVGVNVMLQQEGENVFEVSDLDPASAAVTQGDDIDVSAQIVNTGEVGSEQEIELQIDGTVVETQNVTLEPTEGETVTFESISTADLEPGEYEHSVLSEEDDVTGTLTVEPGVATYTNDEGVVETQNLRTAIADWRTGEIDTDLLRDVIAAWRTGNTLT